MAIFYSKLTRGFYKSEIHKEMPEDVIEITEEQYKKLLEEQSKGKIIEPDSKGKPIVKNIQNQGKKRRALLSDLVTLLISKGIITEKDLPKDLNWRMNVVENITKSENRRK